ncbi:uncharacterized protein LOC117315093 [Pecten maximus]|uniref:uncharacterized protein LOC117315093 n=1 Tax=Pecten maximus TaxID=6579 RepID=UPI0014580128|nr:uncharacterized protein LOC117315093 [Pecten maximus]
MFSKWTFLVILALVVFSGVDSRRRNRKRSRSKAQTDAKTTTDPTMAKRQRMIDMRESLADSLTTDRVKVFLLDSGSPTLVKGRAAIRRMSARHEEMTSTQVLRLMQLLETRIRAIDSAIRSDTQKTTKSVTQSARRTTTSPRRELQVPSNRASVRPRTEVAQRLLVNGRLRSPSRSIGRIAMPSTSETVDRGRFNVPRTRTSESIQRASGTSSQISNRRSFSSSRVSPSFEERLRHSQRSSRPNGIADVDRRRVNIRNGASVGSPSGINIQAISRSVEPVRNTNIVDSLTDAGETQSTGRRQEPPWTDNDLRNRAPNTPFRDFLTSSRHTSQIKSRTGISGKTLQQEVITITEKAGEVGGSIRNTKLKLTTNQPSKTPNKLSKANSHANSSKKDNPVTLTLSEEAISPSILPQTSHTDQPLTKPLSTEASRINHAPSNAEPSTMETADKKIINPTEGPVQNSPQEEPSNPVLSVPVKPKTTKDILTQLPVEPTASVHVNKVEPASTSIPVTKIESPSKNVDGRVQTKITQKSGNSHEPTSLSSDPKILHTKEVPESPSLFASETVSSKTSMVTTKEQSSNNVETQMKQKTVDVKSTNILPTKEIPATQTSLTEQQTNAQIPSPEISAPLSTVDTPRPTQSKNKVNTPSTTTISKVEPTILTQLQEMISKHKEQEILRTGSPASHEEQMRIIKQILSEAAGSPNNAPVIQTTTQAPMNQILQLLQAHKSKAAPTVPVPSPSSASSLLNNVMSMLQAHEARTTVATRTAHVNKAPFNPQQPHFPVHTMMQHHRVVDPYEQQRMAMMSQMGNPMAGMFGGMMGYMNPEMMQEMMFGDTTDAPDPVKPHEESHKKNEEQEGITAAPTTRAPTTTTVTMAQPLRHRTPMKLRPHHHTVHEPQLYHPETRPTAAGSWKEMDVAYLNSKRGEPPHSESLSVLKQKHHPMHTSLSDSQIRNQHRHKEEFLEAQEVSRRPDALDKESHKRKGSIDHNMLVKIKSSIDRALKSAGIDKYVELVLTNEKVTQPSAQKPTTGNQLLDRIRASIEKSLKAAGIWENVKVVLKSRNTEKNKMPLVTKAPAIPTKSVLRPTDPSLITQEGSLVTDIQTNPTTNIVDNAMHGGMSFLSYSERPAKIPADSSNHVFVQNNASPRKLKEKTKSHPFDSLMIGQITTPSPNNYGPTAKNLPQNVELIGGFSRESNPQEQGNSLTNDINKLHNNHGNGWKMIPMKDHSAGINTAGKKGNNVISIPNNQFMGVPTPPPPPPPPMNRNQFVHRPQTTGRVSHNTETKMIDVLPKYTNPTQISEKEAIVNKLIQSLSGSKHSDLINTLSKYLNGHQDKPIINEKKQELPQSSGTGWQRSVTGTKTATLTSEKHKSKDITNAVPSQILVLSQAPNGMHPSQNHIISSPLEPMKSNDKVFLNMNARPENHHDSTAKDVVINPNTIISKDISETSPDQVLVQPVSLPSQNTKANPVSQQQNIAQSVEAILPTVVPSSGPRMIRKGSFSGAQLFRRQKPLDPSRMESSPEPQNKQLTDDAWYRKERAPTLEEIPATQPKMSTRA